jgi:hypothetical protein
MTHKRMAASMVLGALAVILVTACAGVPGGQADTGIMSPTGFGTFFESVTISSEDLLQAPVAEAKAVHSMALSRAVETMTSQQMYDAYFAGMGGCDRHHDIQEDLGAAGGGVSN